ncbi:hypothetical protein DFH09DRAFT_1311873 [Mycena vulgaris]|nr:hypothetical protein DFH09DRAFT_1311873 [Mycena vulgaris]
MLPSKLQADGIRIIEVSMEHVNRHFLPGDLVVVHQNNPDALAQTVHVMKADVDFLMFDEENFAANRPLHQYTSAICAKTLAYRRQTQADDYAAYEAASQANQASFTKDLSSEIGSSETGLPAGSTSSLSHSGVEYSNIYVLVGFKHPNKGFRGQVIRTYNTKERSEHLKSQQASGRRRRYLTGDTKGIMVTIRSQSNQEINVPIENVVHDLTRLRLAQAQYLPSRVLYAPRLANFSAPPQPRAATPPLAPQESDPEWGLRSSTEEEQQREKERLLQEQKRKSEYEEQRLAGERDGTWLRIAGLVGKRLDVTMEGVTAFLPTRDIKVSPKARAAEGKNGVVMLSAVPDIKKQVAVYRTDSALITRRIARVVVLGPDVEGNTSLVGSYAQTQPYITHNHGPDVVAVRCADGSGPIYFHILKLCLSDNQAVGDCATTTFPQ